MFPEAKGSHSFFPGLCVQPSTTETLTSSLKGLALPDMPVTGLRPCLLVHTYCSLPVTLSHPVGTLAIR